MSRGNLAVGEEGKRTKGKQATAERQRQIRKMKNPITVVKRENFREAVHQVRKRDGR